VVGDFDGQSRGLGILELDDEAHSVQAYGEAFSDAVGTQEGGRRGTRHGRECAPGGG
jgi:hypothetical protein